VCSSDLNGWVLQNLAYNYMATKDYQTADNVLDRGLAVAPQSFGLRGTKAKLAVLRSGDLTLSERLLETLPQGIDPEGMVTIAKIELLMMKRRFSDILTTLQNVPGEIIPTDTCPVPKALFEGEAYLGMKDEAKARAALEKALPITEGLVREAPNDPNRHALLGGVLALLGRKEEAIAEGKRATELKPESKDAFDGPMYTMTMAQIYAWLGEKDQALQLIEHLLATPNGVTPAMLKLDPHWDPLRDDSRFQALINRYAKA